MNYLRIKKNADFQKLFNRGKKVFSPTLTLIYFPSAENRMGIAVSKKHGKAVKRNRIKRLLRAVYSENLHLLKGNYQLIILPRVADEYSHSAFEKSIITCFKKISCQGSQKH